MSEECEICGKTLEESDIYSRRENDLGKFFYCSRQCAADHYKMMEFDKYGMNLDDALKSLANSISNR